MTRPHLPLNALRAFEASARHLSFTRAAIELNVTQAAVSHQVKALEQRLGTALFRRLPRGLMLTDEGLAILPSLRDSFDRIGQVLEQFDGGRLNEVLAIGAVGTFALGWLLPRLRGFSQAYPFVDVRLSTNNNRVDIAAEGLDYAIRFGNGAWHGTDAEKLFDAPFSALATAPMASRLGSPADLAREPLLRSYRADEWPLWFSAAGVEAPPIRGPVFDSSWTMVDAAVQGYGAALAPPLMFHSKLCSGDLVQLFDVSVNCGSYWLTWLKSKQKTPAMRCFREWIGGEAANPAN